MQIAELVALRGPFLVPLALVLALATATAGCKTAEESWKSAKEFAGFETGAGIPEEGTVLEHYQSSGFDYASLVAERDRNLSLERGSGRGLVYAPAMSAYLQDVMARILAVAPEKNVPVRVYIQDSEQINAFAHPDGSISLPLGMLEVIEYEDELAFVLGHELAHVIYRHHNSDWFVDTQKKSLASLSLAYDAVEALRPYRIAGPRAELDDMMLGNEASLMISEDAIAPNWTRSQEDAADLLGLDLMTAAGYNQNAVFVFIDKLAEAEKQLEAKRKEPRARVTKYIVSEVTGLNTYGMVETAKLEEVVGQAFSDAWAAVAGALGHTHRAADDRKEFLNDYVDERYDLAAHEARPVAWAPGFKAKGVKGVNQMKRLFANYAAAYDATAAMDAGDLIKAETGARKAVSAPTETATFPRLVFYQLREKQGRHGLANQNIELALNNPEPSLAVYEKAIAYPATRGDWNGALARVEDARKRLGDPPQLLPWRIYLLARDGKKNEANVLTAECRLQYPDTLDEACQNALEGEKPGQPGA
jgi:Zn-dependent protease with chaperone function